MTDLDRLPFPLAYPLHMALAPDPALGPVVRWDNAVFTAYQTMRLAALLMLADYVHEEPDTDPKLPTLIRGLVMPHWQEWVLLADQLARFWTDPKRAARAKFGAVARGWLAISRPSKRTRPRNRKPSPPSPRAFPAPAARSRRPT